MKLKKISSICYFSSSRSDYYIVEKMLEKFADMLPSTQIESAIRQQNQPALTFLLKHTKISINYYLVKGKNGIWLSPLCAAYKYGNVGMFELLLKHNASCMASYQGLPLAHTLLQLGARDRFQQLFLNHYEPALNGNPRFYKTLAAAVARKLEEGPFDSALHHAHAAYERIFQANQSEWMLILCNQGIPFLKFSKEVEKLSGAGVHH